MSEAVNLYEFAGKDRKLRFDMNAFADLEKELGQSIFAWLGGMQTMIEAARDGQEDGELDMSKITFGLNDARLLLWAGLKWADPEVKKPADAGRLLEKHIDDGGDFGEVVRVVFQAVIQSKFIRRQVEAKQTDPPEAERDEETAAG